MGAEHLEQSAHFSAVDEALQRRGNGVDLARIGLGQLRGALDDAEPAEEIALRRELFDGEPEFRCDLAEAAEIDMRAQIDLAGGIERFTYVEWDEATTPGIDASGYALDNGEVIVPDRPGFGLDLDEAAFGRAVATEGFTVSH